MEASQLELDDLRDWVGLRSQLWPNEDPEQHEAEVKRIVENKEMVAFGIRQSSHLIGLIELSLRNIVDGCLSSPVAYIEAWVVDRDCRQQGVGRQLLERAKLWGIENGCSEMGSDTEIAREGSIGAHQKCGFSEVDRVVNFKMSLKQGHRK